MRKYRINEAIVEDADLAEKIKRFAELSDKIDEVTADLKTLKKEYDDIEIHIRPILEQLSETKDKALQVENILITIKRKGYERENVSYKDAFNWLYNKVNAQMKAIIDEALQKNKTLTKIASSIGVQKLSENKLRKSLTSVVGRITSLLKPFISFLSNKNKEIDKTIADFKSKFKMGEAISETKIQPNSGTMVGMRGFSPINESKKITLNEFKSLVKRIIKEEKNNLEKKKTVIFTESQLRNQVKKMLREYDDDNERYNDNDYDDAMRDHYNQQIGYRSERGSINIDPLPNGDVIDVHFDMSSSSKDEPSWEITKAYLYTDNGDGEINLYDPKYADILKIVEKEIEEYMEEDGWYRYDDY